jgi:hypothetical protein
MLGVFLVTAIVACLFNVDVGAASVLPASTATAHGLVYYVVTAGALVIGVALSVGNLTLLDQAKRTDPDGKTAKIVELLSQTNEVLEDMVWREGNLPTGNRTTVRTSLPTVSWRRTNQGVIPSKSTTAQIDDQAAMLEAWSEVDTEVIKLNGNSAAARMSEGRAFLEAMNQEMVQTLFYGSGGDNPEEFTGFAPRYNLTTAPNGSNVIKAGSVDTDNTSIYLVGWGDDTVSGLFAQGSTAGLQHNDYGEVTVEMVAGLPGSRMRALQERWVWKAGLMVKDWRYVVRIANIDVSVLAGATPPDMISLMEQAEDMLPSRLGKTVWYMNRTVRKHLRRIMRLAVGSGGGLTYENVGAGRRVLYFGDSPIRTVDQILNTEALVS